ncbi:cupin domain-containing protein [Streptomyces sp. NEAU-W12]|uniref:cupin domain-containing protein n=1 Tax=Streptomyces sp. NEAU-W12 TaxID=2994668 RepID=UPI00224B1449|nr:cupin domain-containing protein [Streptomyces sp. NEAU-W12]MCX2928211.1 cupin domain-containing protein [Streptomyces sp. NEAU-W12]
MPDFPGAVGLSALRAYPWPTADDEHGGSPHMHLTCTEGYVVTAGRGRLQTLNAEGPRTHTLEPGDVVWFTPGTIHRAVNDEDLRVTVVMQNSGLPEAGDAVLTFPPDHLTPDAYPRAVSLLDGTGRPSPERARARRDLAVAGFTELVRQWESGNTQALHDFCRDAARLVAPRLGEWTEVVRQGPLAAARRTLEQIDALRAGEIDHLLDAESARIARPAEETLGMCGHLRAYDPIRRAGPSGE